MRDIAEQAGDELERIDREMERLNELIGRIIDFSRLDAGLNAARRDELRLEQIVADVVNDVRLEADAKGCSISFRAPDQADCTGDAALLASAVENILRNALRHSPAGGEIQVGLDRDEKQWRIVITDQGAGIPAELHARVFEPFFRVEDHRNPQGGIGLGLAIARQAIAAHGGNIEVKNRSEGGLEVSLYLPITSEKSS
jgi:signal transduction histidine kinase